MKRLWVILGLLLCFFSCKKEELEAGGEVNYPEPTPYQLDHPSHFPDPDIPAEDPMTEEGVALGRDLYYDPLLSKGGPMEGMACASCHLQSEGFTSSTPPGETPILPHINLAWNEAFLWDSKVEGSLENVMEFEVMEFFQTDISQLRKDPDYPDKFGRAFGDNSITYERVEKALAQFLRTIISGDSKFDAYLKGEGSLTPSEVSGFNIFNSEKGDCFHCHSVPLFTDHDIHNIGLDSTFSSGDKGHFRISGDSADLGKFKTPTLRNVALRSTYMHDGRFQSLMEVVEHYNAGVKTSSTLDPIMTKPGKEQGLGLTPQEKQDLVAFLKTLTDTSILNDPDLHP